ncbi:hypothetical protein EV426DRAFT_709542 [Tirmania nivea]|nr:hypothetical protein EV426DRAFT_709542 [Tirmania nivea]
MADPYAPLLERDKHAPGIALSALRQHHLKLKGQNQRIVETGIKMSMALAPIEDGIRIEREEKLAKEDERSVGGRV